MSVFRLHPNFSLSLLIELSFPHSEFTMRLRPTNCTQISICIGIFNLRFVILARRSCLISVHNYGCCGRHIIVVYNLDLVVFESNFNGGFFKIKILAKISVVFRIFLGRHSREKKIFP